MVVRGHSTGKGLNERRNAGYLSWIVDPLKGVPGCDLYLLGEPPGQVNPRLASFLMNRLPSIALVEINICPKLNVIREKACGTNEEVNGIGSHPMPERESSILHPTCPMTVVVPLRRDSIQSASDVRIRILNAEIRGGAPKDLRDIHAEHDPNPYRRILEAVLPIHLHAGRERDEVRNRGNPHPEISHRLIIGFKHSSP